MRGGLPIAVVLLAGCAAVAPGAGTLTRESAERLEAQARAAEAEAVRLALLAADQAPEDLRAQRKAAEIAHGVLNSSREVDRNKLYLRAEATLARLEAHREACSTRVEAGRVRQAAEDFAGAAKSFTASARECRSVPAFLAAGWPLRKLDRCGELVELAALLWPLAPKSDWVPMMDAVAACSNDVTLRQNLAFAPGEVVADYLALLNRRARQRAADEARWRAEQQRSESRSRCESECWSARNSCASSCGNSSSCYSHCQALESVCRSGCY